MLEDYLLREFEGIAKKYYSKSKTAEKKPPKTAEQIKRKMQKLKELYLSDLIEIEEYKKDYTKLKQQLTAINPEPIKEFDLETLRRELKEYPDLDRQAKKEFWVRTIQRIDADNDGAFFVTPS